MIRLILFFFVFFSTSSHASSVWTVTVPPATYSSEENKISLERYIAFSEGKIFLDQFGIRKPDVVEDFGSYDHFCLLSLRFALGSWKPLPKKIELPEVQFKSLIRPYLSEGPHPPSSSYDNGKTYTGYLDFDFAEWVPALSFPDGDTLYYFYGSIQCKKRIPSSQYNQDFADGKLMDDAIIKGALGDYIDK